MTLDTPRLRRTRTTARIVALTIGALLMIGPFLYMVSTSFKPNLLALEWPPRFIPRPATVDNYVQAWSANHFASYFANSVMVACATTVATTLLAALAAYGFARFTFPGRRWREPIRAEDGTISGVLAREQHVIAGEVEVSTAAVGDGLFRLTVAVRNLTPLEVPASRDDALLRSLVSAHTLLGASAGEFVSLTDPPDDCRDAAAGCRNVGVWPVLVGEEGQRDTVLASPIILYDYPRLAPESPGDLFDGTEIDEILSLRILTLTDDEKRLAAAVDERARALLARTEQLGADDLFALHGAIRDRRPVPGGADG